MKKVLDIINKMIDDIPDSLTNEEYVGWNNALVELENKILDMKSTSPWNTFPCKPPEVNKRILIKCFISLNNPFDYITEGKYSADGRWCDYSGDDEDHGDFTVTAWMEIPKQY